MSFLAARAFCKELILCILDDLQDRPLSDDTHPDRDSSSPGRQARQPQKQRQQESHDTILLCDDVHIVQLRNQCQSLLKTCRGTTQEILYRLDDLIKVAYDQFYACPFKDVPECWRRLFTDASIVKACAVVLREDWKSLKAEEQLGKDGVKPEDRELDAHDEAGGLRHADYELRLDTIVRTLDMASIMAGATGRRRRQWIEDLLALFPEQMESDDDYHQTQPSKRRKLDGIQDEYPATILFIPPVRHPIERQATPFLDSFEKRMQCPREPELGPEPLIITGVIEHWPARSERPWKSPRYLLSKTLGGRRLVPVEVGRSYVDEDWGQKIVTFKEFLDEYLMVPSKEVLQRIRRMTQGIEIEPAAEDRRHDHDNDGPQDEAEDEEVEEEEPAVGYLAQHDLFTQIPSLRADICIPDYCYSVPTPPHRSSPLAAKHAANPELETPLLNAWFGPAGTISPLHVDPYHNILAQVVGRKYVRLYAPRETAKVYPRGIEGEGINMENTSQVDVGRWEGWDGGGVKMEEERVMFPNFERAEYVDCVLEAGDCLYIPVGWWHYVRSVSVSFSVSFWWN